MRSLARLCLVGNTIGVAALVLVLSIMNGFNKAQSDRLLSVEPHFLIEGVRAQEKLEKAVSESNGRLSLDEIQEMSVYDRQDVILRTLDGLFSGAVAKGLSIGPLTQLLKVSEDAEEDAQMANRLGSNEVLIGAELAAGLGLYVGDEVNLMAPEGLLLPAGEIPPFAKVKILDLISTGIPLVDSQTIYYDRSLGLGRLSQSVSFRTGLEVRLKEAHRADDWVKVLRPLGFEIESWSERNSALFFALKMEKYAMGTFLVLTLLITSFSLMTVLIMLLVQKRQDIGLLMALGLSRKKALLLFQGIGFALSSSGMFLGFLIGIFLSSILQFIKIPLLPAIYTDPTLPALIQLDQILMILMGLFFLAFLSSWLPVKGSLEMTPSQALRQRH